MAQDSDLLTAVREELLPDVSELGFQLVAQDQSDSFDNATVTLEAGDVCVRIVRERSQVFVDFGSVAKPGLWFDSTVVFDFLGIARDGGFHSTDTTAVLRGLSSLLRAFWPEIKSRFGRDTFARTESALTTLRNAKAAERLGYQ